MSFDSGPDPRSKIPGRCSQGILDPVLARIIRIMMESCLIRAGIQDPRFLGETPKQSGIRARIKNDSKMIRMIRASSVCKIQYNTPSGVDPKP